MNNIDRFNFLEDEKKGLKELLILANKKSYEIYLFGSRINGWGGDIDLIVKGDFSKTNILKDILELSTKFHIYSDTKLDLVPYTEKTKNFIKYIENL